MGKVAGLQRSQCNVFLEANYLAATANDSSHQGLLRSAAKAAEASLQCKEAMA